MRKNYIHSYDDARRLARRRLPWMVFDYIDGAAGAEMNAALNRTALQDLWLQPKVLRNVAQRDVSTTVLGKPAKLPFGIAPMGMCNMTSPDADRLLCALADRHQIPVGASTVGSTTLEDMFEMSCGNAWFQLYVSGSLDEAEGLISRAEAAGYETLVFTVDVPELGRRLREQRRGFVMPFTIGFDQFFDFACHPRWSLTQLMRGRPDMANFGAKFGKFDRAGSRAASDWEVLKRLRDRWKGNLVIKGVLCPDDAVKLKSFGVDAIQVSSHGGRQLDSGIPPILALRRIRDAVGQGFPVFYDSGIRSGEDVIKAYAQGADFVFMGRPFSFAIAAGGARGLDELVAGFEADINIGLAQIGLTKMQDISRDVFAARD